MTILLTGGTGKTSIRIAKRLQEAKVPFVLTSRRGPSAAPAGMKGVRFDWLDESTFPAPFEAAGADSKITAAYLVAPEVQQPAPPMNKFVDYAIKEHGVRRFVLMGGASAQKGEDAHIGKVWSHLEDVGVEFAILNPSWFMENFSEGVHTGSIKSASKIFTASGDAKIPFISAVDIAAVAFHTLVDERPHNTDYLISGPQLLTYDEIAAILSDTLSRKVEHVKLSQEERVKQLIGFGMPEDFSNFLAFIEASTAKGTNETSDVVEKVSGSPPVTFAAFSRENKSAW